MQPEKNIYQINRNQVYHMIILPLDTEEEKPIN